MPVDDILGGARFPTTTVDVCMRGDLQEAWEELGRRIAVRLSDAASAARGRLGASPPDVSDLEAERATLAAEMAAATLTLHMEGVSSAEYQLMGRTAGKPRPGAAADQQLGFNFEAFLQAAVRRCTRRVTAPDGDRVEFDNARWTRFFGAIIDSQMDDLYQAIQRINRRPVRPPSAPPTSATSPPSEPTS